MSEQIRGQFGFSCSEGVEQGRVIALVTQGLCNLKHPVVSKEEAHRPFLFARTGEEREEKVVLTAVKYQKKKKNGFRLLYFLCFFLK